MRAGVCGLRRRSADGRADHRALQGCRRPGALRPPDRAGADETAAGHGGARRRRIARHAVSHGRGHVPRQRSGERREDVRAVGLPRSDQRGRAVRHRRRADRLRAAPAHARASSSGFPPSRRCRPIGSISSPPTSAPAAAKASSPCGASRATTCARRSRGSRRRRGPTRTPTWKDADTLRVEYTVDGETSPRTLERRLDAPGWAKR